MLKKITFGIVLVATLVGVMVWSYERGQAVNNAIEATRLMVIVERQKTCITESDMSCTIEANRMLAVAIAGQLQLSDLSVLSQSDRMAVEQFINEVENKK